MGHSHHYVNEIKKGLAATPAIHLRLLNNWLISSRGVFLLVTLNYTFYTFNYPIILHGKLGLNHSGLNLVLVEHRGGESHRLVVVYELVVQGLVTNHTFFYSLFLKKGVHITALGSRSNKVSLVVVKS